MNSAIFLGGWWALLANLLGAMIVFCCIPAEDGGGWTRYRMAGFFLLWQAFTPLKPWHFDLPALVLTSIVFEMSCRLASRAMERA